jgi:hypothetical protein
MIMPMCDFCGKELVDFGGILFSPPEGGLVKKFHVCRECYVGLVKNINLE